MVQVYRNNYHLKLFIRKNYSISWNTSTGFMLLFITALFWYCYDPPAESLSYANSKDSVSKVCIPYSG